MGNGKDKEGWVIDTPLKKQEIELMLLAICTWLYVYWEDKIRPSSLYSLWVVKGGQKVYSNPRINATNCLPLWAIAPGSNQSPTVMGILRKKYATNFAVICPLWCSFTLKWWLLKRTRATFSYLSWAISTTVLRSSRLLMASPVFTNVMNPTTSSTKYPVFYDKLTCYAVPKLPSIRIFPKINQGRLTHDTGNTNKINQVWSTTSTAGRHQAARIRNCNKGSRGVSRLGEQRQNQQKITSGLERVVRWTQPLASQGEDK